jgi:hypothetical protein
VSLTNEDVKDIGVASLGRRRKLVDAKALLDHLREPTVRARDRS